MLESAGIQACATDYSRTQSEWSAQMEAALGPSFASAKCSGSSSSTRNQTVGCEDVPCSIQNVH